MCQAVGGNEVLGARFGVSGVSHVRVIRDV